MGPTIRPAIAQYSRTGRCSRCFPPGLRNLLPSIGSHDQTSAIAERALPRECYLPASLWILDASSGPACAKDHQTVGRLWSLAAQNSGVHPTATKRLTGVICHASLGPPSLPSFSVLSGRQVSVASSTVGLPIIQGMPATGKRSQPQNRCLAACRPVSRCLRMAASNPTDLPWRGRPGILTAVDLQ